MFIIVLAAVFLAAVSNKNATTERGTLVA